MNQTALDRLTRCRKPGKLRQSDRDKTTEARRYFAVLALFGILGFASPAEAQYKITWDDFSRTESRCSTVCTATRDFQLPCYQTADPNRPFCPVERRCVAWGERCEQVRKRLPDSDLIDLRIEKKAVDPSVVLFVLETPSRIDWYKGITVPDGSGAQWTIWNGLWAPPGAKKKELRHHDEVSLWSHQVHNGQCLLFTKAGFLGWWRNSYFLCGLERLEPGSRVTFTWISD